MVPFLGDSNTLILTGCVFVVFGFVTGWLLNRGKVVLYRVFAILSLAVLAAFVAMAAFHHIGGIVWRAIIIAVILIFSLVFFWRGVPPIETEDEYPFF